MNISAPLRTTYLRASVYNPSYGQNGSRPPLPTLQERGEAGIKRARQFSPLDYATYKQKCNEDRFSVTSYEVDIDPEPPVTELEYSGPLNRLWRMCTVFPYKDISWQVAVVFFFTNATWLINSFFGFLPIVAPNTNFDGEKTIAVPTTLTIAATTFLFGICLGLVGAFNVDRGELTPDEKADARKLEEGMQATASYKPALLGSSDFVWWPTLFELRTIYMPNPAFQAGLIQLLGAAIFTISNISSFPGLIDPKHQNLSQILIFLPTLLGGLCFFTAGLVLMVLMQEKWWKPKIRDVNWHVYFWSAVGAFGFVLTGSLMLLLPGDKFASGLAAFVGRWAFLIGSFLQWYVLMEFYPE